MKDRIVVQVILDGFGLNPVVEGNAVALAKKPIIDGLMMQYPFTALDASGIAVGLPWGEVGNSEVGHTNLGSGLVQYQKLPRISMAVEDKTFFRNKAFLDALAYSQKHKSNIHIIGLVSNGGVHSHIEHLDALLHFFQQNKSKDNVFVHAFTDGRDTNPKAGVNFIATLMEVMKSSKTGKLASVIGRYYGMDRNNTWERTQKAYDLIASGKGEKTQDPLKTMKQKYEEKFDDENMPPLIVEHHDGVHTVKDHDVIIFFNFRPDRMRQIAKAFVVPDFSDFSREVVVKDIHTVTMMQYEAGLPVSALAFPEETIEYPFGRIVAELNRPQFRISETEKYAHVTFFFNGGAEDPFQKEDRKIIPSPAVATYDMQPEMSSVPITDKVVKAISSRKYVYTLINFPNPDMVGHTGNLEATIKAVEACDIALGKIKKAVDDVNGILVVCADHGNAEVMIDPVSGRPHKEHTTNPVPFILCGEEFRREKSKEEVDAIIMEMSPIGLIADIAPTVLELMDVKPGSYMSGRSFLHDIV
ncbi:MAG: 2,3-bisphosphoglycerate-independent phosphoglycerate mutase [Parcubacteria group bacterium]|nr:2,3-bisphosphoglycerate-independent phosphoglycerate mutase [Parcubacteria group bacterium]